MEVNLKTQIELQINVGQDHEAEQGFDWFHLTPEEELVFAIDRARFPRMITAWAAYEMFMGVVDEGFSCDLKVMQRAQKRRADIVRMGVSIDGFQHFAKEYAGMTFRESHAMFCKNQFWQTRNGITRYTDERKRKPPK